MTWALAEGIVLPALALSLLCPLVSVLAKPRPPLPPAPEAHMLRNWRFDEIGGWHPPMLMPLQAENVSLVESWSGYALRMAGDKPAVLEFADIEGDGRTNINCQVGAIRFWFRPYWDSASLGGKGAG